MKNSSCPGGEHMHSSRAGRSETLRKACGALAGMLRVSPVRTTEVAPRKQEYCHFHKARQERIEVQKDSRNAGQ